MLKWAIARDGLDVDAFLVQDKNENVRQWIEGEREPTVKQLEDFSRQVHIPFGYLLLPEPPEEPQPIPFFRTVIDDRQERQMSLAVYDTIITLQRRQEWLHEYLLDNEYAPLPFVGRFPETATVEEVVADIRRTLDFEPEWASRNPTWSDALIALRERVENLRIMMVFNSVVGNNTKRPIPLEECRGFVLIDRMAPFLFVHNGDAKSAQMFTIMHELAHIWFGKSAGFDLAQLQPAEDDLEKKCDAIAAELLVPKAVFLRKWRESLDPETVARHFKVSQLVIARRALDTGQWTRETFFRFYQQHIQTDHRKQQNSPGGDFFKTQRVRLSRRFSVFVREALQSNQIIYRDAYKLTGIKGATFEKYMKEKLDA